MKKIIILAFFASLLWSCDDDSTAGVSKVTNYPVLTLLGDEFLIIPVGTAYTDPGITATEGGVDIEYTTTVDGALLGTTGTTINTAVADDYTITYTATNQDGFDASVSRRVIVVQTGDLVTDISGLYTSTVVRNGASGAQYTDMEYVMIAPSGPNQYRLSDGIGGYYDIGRAYGAGYRAPATINAVNIPADQFTIPDFEVGTFGGGVEMTSFIVNENDGSIDFSADWDSGYTFEVHLEQVQL
jgi:Domain of unknown function (DUF5011)